MVAFEDEGRDTVQHPESWRVLTEISSPAPPTPGRVGIGPDPLHDRLRAPGQILWDLHGCCWANRHPAVNQWVAGSHPTPGATPLGQ